jgi:hypothetical protein
MRLTHLLTSLSAALLATAVPDSLCGNRRRDLHDHLPECADRISVSRRLANLYTTMTFSMEPEDENRQLRIINNYVQDLLVKTGKHVNVKNLKERREASEAFEKGIEGGAVAKALEGVVVAGGGGDVAELEESKFFFSFLHLMDLGLG